MELYIIVCSDLHHATGPYADPHDALDAARKLNKAGKCFYVPVPMLFLGKALTPKDVEEYMVGYAADQARVKDPVSSNNRGMREGYL